MTNRFPYSEDNKRYHTLNFHNKRTYERKMFKAVIDAGLTCPNIDGTKGTGGCIFCDGGSGYFTKEKTVPIYEQLTLERERIHRKYQDAGIIAYFQAHSNTYCSLARLKSMIEEAIESGADGISVATRADCLSEEKVDYLSGISVPLTVELGLQTACDDTAIRINRCHSYDEFLKGYNMLKERRIRACVHIIEGLPGEDREEMMWTAKKLGELRPDGVKIHLLHVIEGTRLADMYNRGEYTPLGKEEYIDIVTEQLRYLPPETVIERITGDGDKRKLIAPLWSADKISVLGGIDKLMKEKDIYQGDLFERD